MHTVELNTQELLSVCNWTSTVRFEHLQLCFDHGCKGKFLHEAERVLGITGIHMSLSVLHELYSYRIFYKVEVLVMCGKYRHPLADCQYIACRLLERAGILGVSFSPQSMPIDECVAQGQRADKMTKKDLHSRKVGGSQRVTYEQMDRT
jgi:hypothetical protein